MKEPAPQKITEKTVTFHVEAWQDFKRESLYLWPKHWEEIAIHKDTIKLNVDYRQYEQMDANGALHVVSARCAGKIIGYWLLIIRPHLHYADSLTAFTDVYFMDQAFRKGLVFCRMNRFVEKTLKARGVQKIFTATKKHKDLGKLFEFMGYQETETVYTKLIGG
jgi:hypothetical protein